MAEEAGIVEDGRSSGLTTSIDLRDDDGGLSASFFLAQRVASLLRHEAHLWRDRLPELETKWLKAFLPIQLVQVFVEFSSPGLASNTSVKLRGPADIAEEKAGRHSAGIVGTWCV